MTTNKIFSTKFIITCVLLFLIAGGLSYYTNTFFPNTPYNGKESKIYFLPETNSLVNGKSETELALIYFGCSTCPSAQNEDLSIVFNELSEQVEKEAKSKDYGYILIGISNERIIKDGINHLNKIADFHEISLGNGMGNNVIQKYVWNEFDGPLSGAVPQILITKRIYDTEFANNTKTIYPNITSEEVLTRKVGLKGIRQILNDEEFYNSI